MVESRFGEQQERDPGIHRVQMHDFLKSSWNALDEQAVLARECPPLGAVSRGRAQ